MPLEEHQAQGPGTDLLPFPALEYLLKTDPYLGSSETGVPNGAFNRELKKLLLNDSALANLVFGFVNRTFAAAVGNAPVSAPDPMPGASATPENGAIAEVHFDDYVCTYQFAEIEWVELGRVPRTVPITVIEEVRVAEAITTDTVAVDMPVGYDITHLRSFYVLNSVLSNPELTVSTCVNAEGASIVFKLSGTPINEDDYQLVAHFQKVLILA